MKVIKRIKKANFKKIYFIFNEIGELIKVTYKKIKIFSKVIEIIKKTCKRAKRTFVILIIAGMGSALINIPAANATLLSLLRAPMELVQRGSYSYLYKYKVPIAELAPKKDNRVVYRSPKELFYIAYASNTRISSLFMRCKIQYMEI